MLAWNIILKLTYTLAAHANINEVPILDMFYFIPFLDFFFNFELLDEEDAKNGILLDAVM